MSDYNNYYYPFIILIVLAGISGLCFIMFLFGLTSRQFTVEELIERLNNDIKKSKEKCIQQIGNIRFNNMINENSVWCSIYKKKKNIKDLNKHNLKKYFENELKSNSKILYIGLFVTFILTIGFSIGCIIIKRKYDAEKKSKPDEVDKSNFSNLNNY